MNVLAYAAQNAFRGFLAQFDAEPFPVIERIRYRAVDYTFENEVVVWFRDGRDIRWRISREALETRPGPVRYTEIYAECCADRLEEILLRPYHERIEICARYAVRPELMELAVRALRERETEIRRQRRDPPRMMVGPRTFDQDSIVELEPGQGTTLAALQSRFRQEIEEAFFGGQRYMQEQTTEIERSYREAMAARQRAMIEAQAAMRQAAMAQYPAMMQAQCSCPLCQPEARAKSIALLKEWLSPDQLAQYEKGKHFEVTGSASGRRYRIHERVMQNVCEVDRSGREIRGYCFGPEGALAVGDIMLAQKIALETDEPGAMAVANTWTIAPLPAMAARVRDALGF